MRRPGICIAATVLAWTSSLALRGAETVQEQRVAQVAGTKGLIAFWEFSRTEGGRWTSHYDQEVVDRGYPVVLRRIGDPKPYTPGNWPYEDEPSKLVYDASGPFGRAVRFNKGYVFAEVPRAAFDRSPLDLHGRRPFTLIAWVKFIGQRHLVAGIWDEGGWDKYGGRRQIALFGGLFGSQGVIAHISSTGAASYPQSNAPGSQYARCRAIDGRRFENGQWVAMAMTFEPGRDEVVAWLDGVATPTRITDPVAQSVFHHPRPVASNPFSFPWPVYSPRSFILKFNGYDAKSSGVSEHWLHVDTEKPTVTYGRLAGQAHKVAPEFRVRFDLKRGGKSILAEPMTIRADDKAGVALPATISIAPGDEIATSLESRCEGKWQRVGSEIRYLIRDGAPFTFGRALGLGTEPVDHGTQLFIDGVAVFNRVLSEKELRKLSFASR